MMKNKRFLAFYRFRIFSSTWIFETKSNDLIFTKIETE